MVDGDEDKVGERELTRRQKSDVWKTTYGNSGTSGEQTSEDGWESFKPDIMKQF